MRLRLEVVAICLLVLASFAFASSPEVINLTDIPGETGAKLVSSGLNSLEIEFNLPSLEVEEVKLAGRDWRRLSIAGGALAGVEGHAALPVFGRMIAVPDGLGVSYEIIDMTTVDLEDWRLAPAEASELEETVVDEAWYGTSIRSLDPSLEIGEPAILRDLRVVPVTFKPVTYDPASGRVRVATSMRVRLTFAGSDKRNAAPHGHDMIPRSFDSFYRDNVLNYDSATKSLPVDQGSYLVICPNNATVLTILEPLLEWRRQQGYNVVLATTSVTGTTTTSIKNYIQTQYDTLKPALEFVTLIGDSGGSISIPAWTENQSGYGGSGDHYYTTLDGGDILADVHLGRLSVTSTAEMTTVVNKILNYETAPPLGTDPGWFTRATLVGDPGFSGITCIFVNQWAKAQLLQHGYTQVDTVWSGNFTTEMMTRFSNGGSLFTYRGWYGMSGMGSSHIMNLTNGGELGFAVMITCDTGSFASDSNCRSEAFLRAANGGGVASIGTATTGTHTRYNNCVFTAVIDHAYNSSDFRVGPALSGGKLAMYNNYNISEPSRVDIWSVWNNLMGDPATEIWTAYPDDLVLDYPNQIPMGANAVDVAVIDHGTGLPVANALVTLYKSGEIRVTAETDAAGRVVLPISGYSAGDLALTVRKHNAYPQRRTIVLGAGTDLVALQSSIVDDTLWGDSDGLLEAGEHVKVGVQLQNMGSVSATSVSAVLNSHDPLVSVDPVAATANYGDIAPGGSAWGIPMYEITVDPAAPGGHLTQLDLVVSSGSKTWTSLVELEVKGSAMRYLSTVFGGPGGSPDPGETGTLTVSLANDGNGSALGLTGVLETDSPWVSIIDGAGSFGDINMSMSGNNAGDTFTISVGSDCYPGHLAAFRVLSTTSDGAEGVIEFTMTVGTASSTDPVGPDGYGYYAYDHTDTSYPDAPDYLWVEIDPTLGGSGTDVGLTDNGWEQDDTEFFSMPFDMVFYGETFNEISICSNGWISMGRTANRQYRNWALPTAGAPDGMIAAFWDNLYKDGATGGVFQWYDSANHRLIVEWSRMRTKWDSGSTGPQQTFEVIIYDPAFHPTPTGDAMIDVMYQTVSNGDNTNGYATAGLMNLDHTDGLTYEYWNVPAPAASQLAAGLAIRYQAFEIVPQGTLQGVVTNATGGGTAASGVQIVVVGAGRSFTTAADGSYQGGVPAGVYDVIATHPDFGADTTTGVSIVVDATTIVDFSLIDRAGPAFANLTVLPDTDDTVGPYVVEANITDYTGIAQLDMFYMSTVNGGPHPLTLTLIDAPTGLYRAEIPGQPEGTRVLYWLDGLDSAGNRSTTASAAPVDALDFRVEHTAIASSDMETVDGWARDTGGDTAGAGLWERVEPVGISAGDTQVVPEEDHTPAGTLCWITGQDSPGGSQGGNDVDGGTTTLLSPVYDLSTYATASVSYWRWYTNDTGFSPGEDWWVVQVNDGSGWQDLERLQTSERNWLFFEFNLESVITLTSTVQFRFEASDIGSGSVVEAGVDDFSLTGSSSIIDVTPPTAAVVYPNGGEIITQPGIGSRADTAVEWTSSDDIAVTRTMIVMSNDGGVSWPDTLADGVLISPVEASWPGLSSTTCRVKVIVFDDELNAAIDVSDGDFELTVVTGVDEGLPARVTLGRNVPNPFNPATEIAFSLPRAGRVRLEVFDVSGRKVRTLVDGRLETGAYTIMWRGENDRGARTSSGTYFYRLDADGEVLTRKMTLLK